MRPKLEDVAKRANVSKTTVSRVLNNRGYLSQETITRVYQAMKELNYQPNVVARQLYQKKTQLIGLLFPTIANPFFGELSAELEKRLYNEGFKVLIGNSMNDPKKEADYLNQLLSKQVDGLIVGTHNQGIKEYNYEHLPVVAIDRNMNHDIPVIESDNYAGGVLATTYLIEQGAKKIIHTNGPITLDSPAKRRRLAYEDTMRQHGLTPITVTLDFNIPYHEKKQILTQIFYDHPDLEAIFASNDIDAALIMQIALELGKKIPADLLLVGYDGTKVIQNILPNLTTIVQPIEAIAQTAVTVLKARLNDRPTKSEYVLPVSLKKGTT
ncbi:LacI family DNA-binding transcriptional regulator [Ligilactobacillus faecis]|uniref:LacI family DNA-binding transcriptional regulator n=1 Tax=Ligilactobacillus faecis TaxID=762833 RepID=UPI002469789B|nr:LacI family DNA-binding transcriptional regulator [Ligilactobacillus faecis]WGN88666.1 LacI family DNA-binding transcriptional regulator [Ligilactobacillus faecis]